MDYLLTEEQIMVRDLARQVAEEKIRPVASQYDIDGTFPWDIVKVMADSDLCGVYIDEEYGGTGGGTMEVVLATEELSRACGGIALAFAATALGTFPVILFGTSEQKDRYLPDIAGGKKLAAFALSEAGAGSDAAAIATTADRKGDYYVLNGRKQWITNGGEAEVYTVIASMDRSKGPRGAAAFIVEKGTEGLEFGKKEDKMGIRASVTRELIFTDCKIPKENLLGREGMGFIVAMRTLDQSRPGVSAQAIGIAQGALDLTVDYVRERRQFERTISTFQGVQFMLADMATEIEAARALTYATARMIDSGVKKISKESAMTKVFASDMAMKVTTDCVQLFGGYGYMRDYPIEKYMRDAKITQIYEGTNQIQRVIIASGLLKEKTR